MSRQIILIVTTFVRELYLSQLNPVFQERQSVNQAIRSITPRVVGFTSFRLQSEKYGAFAVPQL